MSEFSSLEITLARNYDENGGDFRTLKVDDTHEGRLWDALFALYRIDYEVVSAVVDGYDFLEDIWEWIDQDNVNHLVEAFDALCADKHSADIIVAFLSVMPSAEVSTWYDSVYFRGADYEEVVREWVATFHKRYEEIGRGYYETAYVEAEVFPDWMATDENFWIDTLDNIANQNGSTVVEFNTEVFYFG